MERTPTHLTLVGRTPDGRRLRLVDAVGSQFTVDLDHRLRAVTRAEASPAEGETEVDSALRPREIQSRIRAGESAESVAQAAGTSVDQILVYASPVLAERAHRAERALRAAVRRVGEFGGARTLGEAVTAQLHPLNISADSVEWDSWRREDGKWQIVGRFTAPRREGFALFALDLPGNFVVAENPDARWLLGEEVEEAPPGPASAGEVADGVVDLQSRRQRATQPEPVAAAPAEPEPEPASERAEEQVSADDSFLDAVFAEPHAADNAPTLDFEQPDVYDFPDLAEPPAKPGDFEPDPAFSENEIKPNPPTPPKREVRKTRGRASVPSWDEIMFGGDSD